MANLAALRVAVFSLSAKNLTGGGVELNPPPPVRGLILKGLVHTLTPDLASNSPF